VIDRNQKVRLACNKFAYKKTKNAFILRDMLQKNVEFPIRRYSNLQIKRPHIKRSNCMELWNEGY